MLNHLQSSELEFTFETPEGDKIGYDPIKNEMFIEDQPHQDQFDDDDDWEEADMDELENDRPFVPGITEKFDDASYDFTTDPEVRDILQSLGWKEKRELRLDIIMKSHMNMEDLVGEANLEEKNQNIVTAALVLWSC